MRIYFDAMGKKDADLSVDWYFEGKHKKTEDVSSGQHEVRKVLSELYGEESLFTLLKNERYKNITTGEFMKHFFRCG